MVTIYQGNLPTNSLLKNVPKDYIDSYSGTFTQEMKIEDVVKLFFTSSTQWAKGLFYIRNKIVKIFKLKASDIENKMPHDLNITIGKSIGLFKIIDKTENEVIIGEDDKHLNFRVSIYIENIGSKYRLSISTIVMIHNVFGKIYFFIIKPFHKIIVKKMVSTILKELRS